MTPSTISKVVVVASPFTARPKRIESIDLLRGFMMIIMALDHVRDYFHYDAFFYDPTDLQHTDMLLFFTRFITHYCAPVFVFLAGISAYIYGTNKSKGQSVYFLFTRGIWLVFTELFIISLAWTFNPRYPLFNLQVFWAIGISMIVLSMLVYLKHRYILFIAIALIACHNLFDALHIPGNGIASFIWSVVHEPADFVVGHFKIAVRYPVMPWIGIMALGYCCGSLYNAGYDPGQRKKVLLFTGFSAIVLFLLLRSGNIYGDGAAWFTQKNTALSLVSFLNVSKYPPSLLYILVTLGPAMIFLALAEKALNRLTAPIAVFGRVPFFYYVIHLYLIHLFAIIGAITLDYNWSDMILSNRVNRVHGLKGYGFNLFIVYLLWLTLILNLYPCCKWFDAYKRRHQSNKPWLTYL